MCSATLVQNVSGCQLVMQPMGKVALRPLIEPVEQIPIFESTLGKRSPRLRLPKCPLIRPPQGSRGYSQEGPARPSDKRRSKA